MPQLISSPAEISARLKKLRYITDEIVIAANLAGSAPNSDMARMLARHIGVRTADFISHARQLRNCLPSSPASTKFKNTVNTFADEFEENLELARHKIGAHLQDMDFLERIDIWVAIDASMVDYFASGAREIWDLIADLGVAQHQPFVSPAILADPRVASILAYLATPVAQQATFGTDPLAFGRANTSTIYNGKPIHVRAGQLALLRRWIRIQHGLLTLFQQHREMVRIIKARIITDIVSFRDCLITRALPATASQAMEGLDALIAAQGKVPEAIQEFTASSRDAATIEPMRDLRNRMGGHLEIGAAVTLHTLKSELDEFNLDMALRHYATLEAVFVETCRSVDFLATHLMDGMEVGAVLVRNADAAPFDPARPDIATTVGPSLTFSQAEMEDQLHRWISGHMHLRRDAIDYFREAFARAPLAETRDRIEWVGSSQRHHRLEIKTSHLFLRDALNAATPGEEEEILRLASQCPGYRDSLSDVLAEYHLANGGPPSPALLRALGTLAPWWLDSVRTIVEGAIEAGHGPDMLLARKVLLRIFLREEGVKRMNRSPGHIAWPAISSTVLAKVPAALELTTFLALTSTFIGRDIVPFIDKFQVEYRALADQALATARQHLAGTLDAQRGGELQQLLYRGHIAQAVLHIVTTGPEGHERPAKAALLHAFRLGHIETGSSPEEGTAVAEILIRSGAPVLALEVLDRLRRRAPGNIEPALRTVEVLAGIEGSGEEAKKIAGEICEQFTLDAASDLRLDKVEAQLTVV